jgi:hypothetical protein
VRIVSVRIELPLNKYRGGEGGIGVNKIDTVNKK